MKHIMLDLETLSSRNNAVIVAIGAVRFDLNELKLGPEFYRVVDARSCQDLGLHIDSDTIYWWMRQSPKAREVFSDDPTNRITIQRALAEFGYFVRSEKDNMIWGNGASFDNVVIRNAYKACGFITPWSHKEDVCYRTIRRMFPHEKFIEGTEHNALDDAKSQAQTMINIFEKLGGQFVP